MTVYVRAARLTNPPAAWPRHITGSVLHLAVHVPDPSALTPGMGHDMPLCGGKRSPNVEAWPITGPWAQGWQRHAHWPLCRDCQRTLDRLAVEADDQHHRHLTGARHV